MPELIEVASGLAFPEGPIAMPDGSVVLVEMFGPRLTRVQPDGSKETIAEIPGGPNGAALGPDGLFYVCNNGGRFTETDMEGLTFPGGLHQGELHRRAHPDRRPGDRHRHRPLHRVRRAARCWPRTTSSSTPTAASTSPTTASSTTRSGSTSIAGIYYAQADGSGIKEVVYPSDDPNGIGLSPDGTKLYWAETWRGRILQRDDRGAGRGRRARPRRHVAVPLRLPRASSCSTRWRSTRAGNVCVATIVNGGVSVSRPQGELVDFVATGDLITTNVCFGGDDLTHRVHHAVDDGTAREDDVAAARARRSSTSTPERGSVRPRQELTTAVNNALPCAETRVPCRRKGTASSNRGSPRRRSRAIRSTCRTRTRSQRGAVLVRRPPVDSGATPDTREDRRMDDKA